LEGAGLRGRPAHLRPHLADADCGECDAGAWELGPAGRGESGDGGWWLTEPDVGRVAHGVPARVDRLRSLGNALVPQIAQWLGNRILAYEESRVT
jgi:DNA (cytosine-5)-methyltransferase 1